MTRHTANLAAIDIGTNSFHLIIAEVDRRKGRFKILDREKEIVRLGAGSSDMKYLSSGAMNRGVETIKRFRMLADSARASIRAVATSAVREALNQEEFLRLVRSETDVKIEIVSGQEEARLIYLGVLQALPVYHDRIVLIDIGGGSTEFLVGRRREVISAHSLKIGAVRLTQRFFPTPEIDRKSVKRCREFIIGTMNPVTREIRRLGYEIAVGSSGTILNIAEMIRRKRGETAQAGMNNVVFDRDELSSVVNRIIEARNAKQRMKIDGLDPNRADIIVAGAIILEQVFMELRIKEMTVSEFALREGILFDTMEKRLIRRTSHHITDIRYESLLHFAETLGYEKEHAHHVSKLATSIFDQTKHLHKLGTAEREFLEAAALLHETGLAISHNQHHRHAYYLIRNSELMGFTENEKEIIANVARYHRKSHPKIKHEGFCRLNPDDQAVVTKLSSILRIADGLDRTHASAITDITCRTGKEKVICHLKRNGRTRIDMEIWGAERKKELFEETFGVEVKFLSH